jgi:hypothetical protein
MNNIYGNFKFWIGVVEDRKDPEKLGRCKVRVYGYHTDNKGVLPTNDLPWCVPIMPITSASVSGVGTAPVGVAEGSWVLGFFLDGEDCQQPAMLGTIPTKVAKVTFTQVFKNLFVNPDTALRDSSGNIIRDSNDNIVPVGTPYNPNWSLGQTSEKYESGGKGAGTISDYEGSGANSEDGAGYGRYQLASFLPAEKQDGTRRRSSKNSPVIQFINSFPKWKSKFSGLTPATSAFDTAWKSAASSDAEEFSKDQHTFIKNNCYDVMISNLKRENLDLQKYGPAVQDLIWSTAVQYGPNNTKVFTIPLANKADLTDRTIVDLVSSYKKATSDAYFSSSDARTKASLKTRFENEKQDLLKLIP